MSERADYQSSLRLIIRKAIKVFVGAGIGAIIGMTAEIALLGAFMTIIAMTDKEAGQICVNVKFIVIVASSTTIGGAIGGMIGEIISLVFAVKRAAIKGAGIGTVIVIIIGIIIGFVASP